MLNFKFYAYEKEKMQNFSEDTTILSIWIGRQKRILLIITVSAQKKANKTYFK